MPRLNAYDPPLSDAPKPNDAHGIDLRREGLTTPDAFAADSRLVVWRDIPERRNATLDLADRTRLHVKLIRPPHGRRDVSREVGGIRLLERAGIATVPLVSHGVINSPRRPGPSPRRARGPGGGRGPAAGVI